MFKFKLTLIYLIVFLAISCSGQKTELIELPFEHDLFPEGIAIDQKTKKVYLNSLKNKKIVNSAVDGSNPENFLKTGEHNYLAGFGMTIKGDTLYALGNSLTARKNKSVLLLLQLSSGDLIDSYSLDNSDFHYWNDLAISSTNEIFITDSESNKIYNIQRPSKNINVYIDSTEIPNSNGITISDNDEYLYLASAKGICVVKTASKKLINKPNEEYSGIDGLKFYKGNLYGIVNGWRNQSKNGFYRFVLDRTESEIIERKKIIEFTEDFNTPTTFDVLNGYIYFVMNTQLNNFDEITNKIVDVDRLESYIMMKIKVE
ncbi:hypothetical protein [Aquimarina algicola]|uniref:SMP-30/Gluconolactonase/LRE-like region domain-containing protein n=1 Tax=Aquimarina algicola TaxID=2589995 RepID=A0A504J6X4_9FLAO|nr:hypothetical protein [Aquimarina algicola]TPN86284.1 hypothetical protein FHK87_13540 [Aquimarina algicola]